MGIVDRPQKKLERPSRALLSEVVLYRTIGAKPNYRYAHMYVSCKHLSTSLSLIIPAAAQPSGQAVIYAWRLGTDCRYVYPAHTKVAQDLHRPMGYQRPHFPLPHSTHRSIILPSICTQSCLEHSSVYQYLHTLHLRIRHPTTSPATSPYHTRRLSCFPKRLLSAFSYE
jgi:hypothetical protein